MSWLPDSLDPQKRALDPDEAEHLNQRLRAIRDQQMADLRGLLRNPAFKRLLLRLIGPGGELPLYQGHTSERCEGMRDVALFLLGQVNAADPTAWGRILLDVGKAEDRRRRHAADQ